MEDDEFIPELNLKNELLLKLYFTTTPNFPLLVLTSLGCSRCL